MKNNILIYAVSLLLLYITCFDKLIASPATPDPVIVEFPQILINEVSFKDPDYDWVELYVIDDNNSGNGASIRGLQVQDDGIFLSVDVHVMVKTGDYILINFKSENTTFQTYENGVIITTDRKGLTGTTEQVVIKKHDDSIIDAVCWTSSTPTSAEKKDFLELLDNDEWEGTSINDCIFSETITSRESIGRTSLIDTNSASDWEIFKNTTPGEANFHFNEDNITEEEDENEENDDEKDAVNQENDSDSESEENLDQTISEEENSEVVNKNTKSESIHRVENNEICFESVVINEVMPKPPGDESKNEWIELYNKSDDECNLYKWIIDDREGGSKPYKIINDVKIKAKGYILLPSWQTKIRLNNSEDSVRLFSPDETIVDELKYKNAREFVAYARNENDEFEWTTIPTPLLENIFNSKDNDNNDSEIKSSDTDSKNTDEENGTLSDEIHITEIFPNPQGPDKGKEWLEIHNASQNKVYMGNWTIDTGEDSKNKFTFKNIAINSGDYVTLSDSELSFALRNTENTIRINNFKGETVDLVTYNNVQEAKSYMKINLDEYGNISNEWIWTTKITPGAKNLSFKVIKGEIIDYQNKEQLLFLQDLQDRNGEYKVQIAEGGDVLTETIFAKGNVLKIKISESQNDLWLLENYEIIEQSNEETANETDIMYILLSSVPPLGFLGYMGVKKLNLFCLF